MQAVEDYPPIDASTIAPLTRKGQPDLYNFMPSRFITQAEAKARGWTYFFEGEACQHAHVAPRWVSNSRMCVDCNRLKRTRQTIGAKAPAAVNALTGEIRQLAPVALAFEWTAEKRAQLIEAWINTGDIASARDAIQVTPFEYSQELERNAEFAEDVAKAEPWANQILEERAIQLALAGNDRLLTKVLAAKFPNQYRESIKVDITQTAVSRLTDAEIAAKLAHYMARQNGSAVDAEIVEPAQLPAPISN